MPMKRLAVYKDLIISVVQSDDEGFDTLYRLSVNIKITYFNSVLMGSWLFNSVERARYIGL